MADKDRQSDTSEGEPEPVDAEFEPASDDAPETPKKRSGPGWIGAIALALAAAAVGGATAWVIERYAPGALRQPEGADTLSARIVELERQMASQRELDALQSRIAALEEELGALDLRAGALADLDSRVSALEDAPAGGTGAPSRDLSGLRERVSSLETAVETARQAASSAETSAANALDAARSAQSAMAAVESRGPAQPDGGAAPLAALDAVRARLDELSGRVTGLASRLDDAQARIDAAASRAERAETLAREAGDTAAAASEGPDAQTGERALALAALADAARSGDPFEAERAALARVWADAPEIDAIQSIARNGAPTRERLTETFPREDALEAAGRRRSFFGLVAVSPAAGEAGEDAQGLIDSASARLAEGDLAGAVDAVARLDGAPGEAVSAWIARARDRLQLEAALDAMREALVEEAAR